MNNLLLMHFILMYNIHIIERVIHKNIDALKNVKKHNTFIIILVF